jgi:hypothetical protein
MGSKSITLTGTGLAAEISEIGAELVRLQDQEGRELLWNGDATIWAGRAPLLFESVKKIECGMGASSHSFE